MNPVYIFSILLFIGAAQGVLLSIALILNRRGNAAANRILAVLLTTFSITIFFHAAGQLRYQSSPAVGDSWIGHVVFFLFGPLIFFYAKALTARKFRLHFVDSIHLLPFILSIIFYLIINVIPYSSGIHYESKPLLLFIMPVQMLAYFIVIIKILKNHATGIRRSFSSLEKINLRWLQFIVYGQAIIWSAAFFIEIFKHGSYEINYMWLLVSIFMYIIGYFSISQPEIFTTQMQEEASLQTEKKKYEKSALSAEQGEIILTRLRTLMQSGKPYLDSTLTLPSLAKQLSVSTHHLSQIINERLGRNFFEFVNEYRVEEAKQMLIDPKKDHLTIAAIGFESGFNSVSSFNSIFKKIIKTTPSRYRSQIH